jgi:hypothetical protein
MTAGKPCGQESSYDPAGGQLPSRRRSVICYLPVTTIVTALAALSAWLVWQVTIQLGDAMVALIVVLAALLPAIPIGSSLVRRTAPPRD